MLLKTGIGYRLEVKGMFSVLLFFDQIDEGKIKFTVIFN
jgi:hypothetical protein